MRLATAISILALQFSPHINKAGGNDSLMIKLLLLEQRVMNAGNDTLKAFALIEKATLHKGNSQFTETVNTLNRVNVTCLIGSQKNNFYYQKAFALFMTSQYSQALLELLNMQSNKDFSEECEILYLMLLVENERWNDFEQEYLNQKSKKTPDSILSAGEFERPAILDPDHYVRLSARLPGLGMMKSGHTRKGLTSLGLQLFFVGFGIYNFSTAYYFTGLFSGLMPARKFYLGGKLFTHSLVEKRNQIAINNCKKKGYDLIALLYSH